MYKYPQKYNDFHFTKISFTVKMKISKKCFWIDISYSIHYTINKERRRWIMQDQVQEVLNKLRPYLLRDGGDVELIDVDDEGIVLLRLMGACGNCPSSTITLKAGIERALMAEVPGVTEIEQVF